MESSVRPNRRVGRPVIRLSPFGCRGAAAAAAWPVTAIRGGAAPEHQAAVSVQATRRIEPSECSPQDRFRSLPESVHCCHHPGEKRVNVRDWVRLRKYWWPRERSSDSQYTQPRQPRQPVRAAPPPGQVQTLKQRDFQERRRNMPLLQDPSRWECLNQASQRVTTNSIEPS